MEANQEQNSRMRGLRKIEERKVTALCIIACLMIVFLIKLALEKNVQARLDSTKLMKSTEMAGNVKNDTVTSNSTFIKSNTTAHKTGLRRKKKRNIVSYYRKDLS